MNLNEISEGGVPLRHNADIGSANKKSKFSEATGDEKFDSMLGKITGNSEPQDFDTARADRVKARAENPDKETIDALNKMMYDMHITMMTANELMKKLTGK